MQYLDLSSNHISSLQGLGGCIMKSQPRHLKYRCEIATLNFPQNRIHSLEGIGGFQMDWGCLALSNNQISSLNGMDGVKALPCAFYEGAGLAPGTPSVDIHLDHNLITTLEGLTDWPGSLNLGYNQISSFKGLSKKVVFCRMANEVAFFKALCARGRAEPLGADGRRLLALVGLGKNVMRKIIELATPPIHIHNSLDLQHNQICSLEGIQALTASKSFNTDAEEALVEPPDWVYSTRIYGKEYGALLKIRSSMQKVIPQISEISQMLTLEHPGDRNRRLHRKAFGREQNPIEE